MNLLIDAIVTDLRAAANPDKSEAMAAYMKGRFTFLGLMSKERKEVEKVHFPVWKKNMQIDPMEFAKTLWDQKEREFQYVAMDWMKASSLWKIPNSIIQFENWITDHSWWDSVDFLASTCVGGYFLRFPDERDVWIEKWNNSPNFWLNRTALIFQLKYKNKVDSELLFALIDNHKDQKEFFIRKAIGWALREVSKSQPDLVREYLNSISLSGLSFREASKYLLD